MVNKWAYYENEATQLKEKCFIYTHIGNILTGTGENEDNTELTLTELIASVNISIQSLENGLTDTNNTVNTLTDSVSSLSSSISTANTEISSLSSDVETLQSDLQSTNTSISNLSSRTSTAENTIATLQTANQSLNNSVSSINTTITSLNNTISSINTDTDNLQTSVADNISGLQGLTTRTAALETATNDTNWIEVTFGSEFTSTADCPVRVRKIGNMVYLQGCVTRTADNAITSGAWYTLFTLPAGLKPTYDFYFTVSNRNYSNVTGIYINTNGECKAWVTSLDNAKSVSLTGQVFFAD